MGAKEMLLLGYLIFLIIWAWVTVYTFSFMQQMSRCSRAIREWWHTWKWMLGLTAHSSTTAAEGNEQRVAELLEQIDRGNRAPIHLSLTPGRERAIVEDVSRQAEHLLADMERSMRNSLILTPPMGVATETDRYASLHDSALLNHSVNDLIEGYRYALQHNNFRRSVTIANELLIRESVIGMANYLLIISREVVISTLPDRQVAPVEAPTDIPLRVAKPRTRRLNF